MAWLATIAGCGRTDVQPILNKADVVGVWASSRGGLLTFEGNHRVIATNLRLSGFPELPDPSCAHLSTSGTWEFLSLGGDSGPDVTTYGSGNAMALVFVGTSETPPCTGTIQLVTWRITSTVSLCLSFDPDSPCAGYVFAKRS